MEKYYTCNKCRFTFCFKEECGQCPDCGKKDIREATKKEIEEYHKYREEFKNNKNAY